MCSFLQVTYPYIMAKVRLQARYSDEDEAIEAAIESDKEINLAAVTDLESGSPPKPMKKKQRYTGSVDVLRKVYREKGVTGWYQVRTVLSISFLVLTWNAHHSFPFLQGMQAQITKAVLSQALLFGIKEELEELTVVLLESISRLDYRRRIPGLS
jgi:adenine nucleotide transporter 17